MPAPFRMKLHQKSCCGCSIKTGALVICYITLIQAVVAILNILSGSAPEVGKDRDFSNEYKRDLTLVGVVTIVVVAHALYGIYKKKPGYMVPFLLFKLLILFIFTMILGFAPAIVDQMKTVFIRDQSASAEDFLPCFIITVLLYIAIEGYSLLILFSHYQNVRQEAFDAAHAPPVGFTAAIPDPMTVAPSYSGDLPKKQPPPPYAV